MRIEAALVILLAPQGLGPTGDVGRRVVDRISEATRGT